MRGYTRDIERHLKQAGWMFKRHARGSHAIWENPDTNICIPVPMRMDDKTKAWDILKQAQLDPKLIP